MSIRFNNCQIYINMFQRKLNTSHIHTHCHIAHTLHITCTTLTQTLHTHNTQMAQQINKHNTTIAQHCHKHLHTNHTNIAQQ